MDTKTVEMVKGWFEVKRGTATWSAAQRGESAAKLLARTVHCGIREARQIVLEVVTGIREPRLKPAVFAWFMDRHAASATAPAARPTSAKVPV